MPGNSKVSVIGRCPLLGGVRYWEVSVSRGFTVNVKWAEGIAVALSEQVAVLNKHTGLVKGVAWDPVGKYLSSQSEDKTLRIWRTVDWKEERVIREPFAECSGTTHVLRLCWSPDGQYLVSAHARNGPGPTAQIIERKGWATNKVRSSLSGCARKQCSRLVSSLSHLSVCFERKIDLLWGTVYERSAAGKEDISLLGVNFYKAIGVFII